VDNVEGVDATVPAYALGFVESPRVVVPAYALGSVEGVVVIVIAYAPRVVAAAVVSASALGSVEGVVVIVTAYAPGIVVDVMDGVDVCRLFSADETFELIAWSRCLLDVATGRLLDAYSSAAIRDRLSRRIAHNDNVRVARGLYGLRFAGAVCGAIARKSDQPSRR